jgi:hypothetical protein
MKATAHAWLALMAMQRIRALKGGKYVSQGFLGKNFPGFFLGDGFDEYFQKQSAAFAAFFDKHKDSFLQGAWFPDTVISDNLTGGHTFKLRKPKNEVESKQSHETLNFTLEHLHSLKNLGIKEARFKEKLYLLDGYNLPDRCEAVSEEIRDMILIQDKEKKGSDILFNDDQITLYFLMLSHYLADAHVPPHCDSRDFYGPSTIHPDMEGYWDGEIEKHYEFDKKRGVFDYDIEGAPEMKEGDDLAEFKKSVLGATLAELASRKWTLTEKAVKAGGERLYGKGNKKVYDYVKAVCYASYLISTDFIPEDTPEKDYKKLKIMDDPAYKKRLDEVSANVLADAIDSIAMIWMLTWDRYKELVDQIAEKTKKIEKEGRIK